MKVQEDQAPDTGTPRDEGAERSGSRHRHTQQRRCRKIRLQDNGGVPGNTGQLDNSKRQGGDASNKLKRRPATSIENHHSASLWFQHHSVSPWFQHHSVSPWFQHHSASPWFQHHSASPWFQHHSVSPWLQHHWDRGDVCVRASSSVCEDTEGDVCVSGGDSGRARCGGVTPTRGGPAGRGGGRGLRRFEEIPHTGSSGWLNLVKFWREDRFKLLHKHMERTFTTLGPIYRNGAEWRADRLLLNREVMMAPAVRRFLPLLDEVSRDFCRLLATRVEKEGGEEERGHSLTFDPSPDLFHFALEGCCLLSHFQFS
eukprot:XP_014068644.1 PREDICTED: uncharacterized protein LOC106612206 [Salmo salar]